MASSLVMQLFRLKKLRSCMRYSCLCATPMNFEPPRGISRLTLGLHHSESYLTNLFLAYKTPSIRGTFDRLSGMLTVTEKSANFKQFFDITNALQRARSHSHSNTLTIWPLWGHPYWFLPEQLWFISAVLQSISMYHQLIINCELLSIFCIKSNNFIATPGVCLITLYYTKRDYWLFDIYANHNKIGYTCSMKRSMLNSFHFNRLYNFVFIEGNFVFSSAKTNTP